MRLKINFLYIPIIFLSAIGCIPQKNVVYFQGARNQATIDSIPMYGSQDYEYIIGPTDQLAVQIDGVDDVVFAAFRPGGNTAGASGLLVDKQGQIELPVLGKIKVSGLTLPQASDTIKSKLLLYITDTTLMYVNVRTLTFPVTIIGEVAIPGIYQAEDEFMTITELLAKSGDLTPFANRKTIKLYRTDRETKLTTVYQLDLTKADLVQPILSRLQPNDVLYVEPLRRKQFQSAFQVIGFGTSIVSIGLLVLSIYQRF
jgi:polysaccharide biosynthesis/export protein